MPLHNIQSLFEEIVKEEIGGYSDDDLEHWFASVGSVAGDQFDITDDCVEEKLNEYLDNYDIDNDILRNAILAEIDYREWAEEVRKEYDDWYERYKKPLLKKEEDEGEDADDESDDTLTAESDCE